MDLIKCAVSVPVEYHSKIIGVRGAHIREYRDKYGVQVDVPKQQEANNNDQITITGRSSLIRFDLIDRLI